MYHPSFQLQSLEQQAIVPYPKHSLPLLLLLLPYTFQSKEPLSFSSRLQGGGLKVVQPMRQTGYPPSIQFQIADNCSDHPSGYYRQSFEELHLWSVPWSHHLFPDRHLWHYVYSIRS